jgi:membrane-associated phospholipid phosphatase
MHWLQTLDTGLFNFINQSLSNPFFDWLMPPLSGVPWFIPSAVALGLAMLCFGSARARLCALMMMLVVALGDPLVINTIKHAIARPRPCMVLPDVIERLGCTGSGSMPSAHAANWFAMTMIAFLFYRRSAWFMLPMALAVSFSRVYNGVHYPGDVLAGAILGAGYAVALAVTFETTWQWLGKKWFPLWHAQLPSLLNPVQSSRFKVQSPEPQAEIKSEIGNRKSEIEWFRLGYLLIFVMLIGRWLYIASGTIDLEKDEAYQWLWSKHLALSYISKPPGIALIQFIGTSLFGDTQFGVRFFAPLFAAILSVMVLRFFAREVNARAGFWLLLIVTAAPLLGIGTILMTIDPPLVLCWMWAVVAGWRAAQPDGKTRDWLVVGVAMALGFLCKYTATSQLVCWAVLFALWKPARAHLRRPGPWLALLVFLVCTTPVLLWNIQNGWVTVSQVAADASVRNQWHPTLRYFWDFLYTQAGLLNPIFFAGMLWAMVGFWRQRRERPLWLYLFCMGAPLFLGYWLYSFHSRILPNWPVAAVLPLFCLMVAYWDELWRAGSKWIKPSLAIGLVLGFCTVAMMYQSNLIGKITGELLPGEKDPLRRVRAWKPTAALVETEREKLETEGKPAFIIADHYGMTGLFSFYLPDARAALKSVPLVYCVDADGPVNQFYFWPQYNYRAQRKGQNAIYVTELNPYPLERGWLWKWLMRQRVKYAEIPSPLPKPPQMLDEFESVTDLGEFQIKLGDRVFRRLHLWACYDLK